MLHGVPHVSQKAYYTCLVQQRKEGRALCMLDTHIRQDRLTDNQRNCFELTQEGTNASSISWIRSSTIQWNILSNIEDDYSDSYWVQVNFRHECTCTFNRTIREWYFFKFFFWNFVKLCFMIYMCSGIFISTTWRQEATGCVSWLVGVS